MKKLLDEIANVPGRNDKLAILEKNKSNDILKQVLDASLNPYKQYYIRKIPIHTIHTGKNTLLDFIDHIDSLSRRKVTGHAAIEFLKNELESLTEDDAVVAERIIRKDLRCGIQESSVNKVWPKLIPSYPVLLAQPGDVKHLSNIVYPCISQCKADGSRFNAICNSGIGTFSRAGREIDLLGVLDAEFTVLEKLFGGPCVFDGELTMRDSAGNVIKRSISNGVINKAIKGTIEFEEANMVTAEVWDMIPYSDFISRKCKIPYRNRYAALKRLVESAELEKISLLESIEVNSYEEALAHFASFRSRGLEGSILKNMTGIWEDKRSNDLVKMKAEEEADLEVIGWNKGTVGTKNEYKMGSLICASSDRKIEVSISGFSDSLRDEITDNINDWIGCIVTVRYNERISSSSRPGVESLFLPRFVERRFDKDIANSSDEII